MAERDGGDLDPAVALTARTDQRPVPGERSAPDPGVLEPGLVVPGLVVEDPGEAGSVVLPLVEPVVPIDPDVFPLSVVPEVDPVVSPLVDPLPETLPGDVSVVRLSSWPAPLGLLPLGLVPALGSDLGLAVDPLRPRRVVPDLPCAGGGVRLVGRSPDCADPLWSPVVPNVSDVLRAEPVSEPVVPCAVPD